MPLENDVESALGMPGAGAHGSPLFDYLTAFVPRKLKDLFRLCEYLYFNCAQIYAVLQKFCTYPITDVVYSTSNEALKEKHKNFHDKTLKIKRQLIRAAIDKFVYGNAFFSLYVPFVRFLKCAACGHLTNAGSVDYKFKLKKMAFTYECANCKIVGDGEVVDRRIVHPEHIAIIRWDPKLMDIDYNPITGHSEYYWTIPRELKERISKGNKHLINTMPMAFLTALKDDKVFKFSEGQIFHMKMDAPAGIEAQWGFPPLSSTIKLFFFAAVLRKANEAIALDYIVPLRIISPKTATPNADPVLTLSLSRWAGEMKTSVKRWRRDPLHILWSPIPAEVTHLGGQARALMTLGEIQAAEDNIIAALGLPKEFIYGGFSAMGSGIQLRVLENQLLHQTSDLNDLLQWVTDKTAQMLSWETCPVELAPFKLIDDIEQKGLLINLNTGDPAGPWVSRTTLGEAFDIDLIKERKLRKEEAIAEIRFQQELQVETSKLQNSLASRVQSQAMMGQTGLNYDQQAVLAQADQMVQQLMSFDPGTRQSQMHALEAEDKVMYAVVKDRMQDMQTQQNHQMLTQARAQAGQGGGAPAPEGALPGGAPQAAPGGNGAPQ